MPGMPAIPEMALSRVARGIPIEVAASSAESSSDAQQPAKIVDERDKSERHVTGDSNSRLVVRHP